MNERDIELPIRAGTALVVANRLLEHLPSLLDTFGARGAIAPTLTHSRSWSAIDGAQPPYCPYVDTWAASLTHGEWSIRVSAEEARWNPDEVGNARASMYVAHGDSAFTQAYGAASQTPVIDSVCLNFLTDPGAPDAQAFVRWVRRVLGP